MTWCIVGAGAAGLSAARRLRESSIPFEVIERERDVGGLWDVSLPHGPMYHSAHLISSKPLTEFPDYPMPADYPDYPGHAQALAYLRGFARAFGLYDSIRFGEVVNRVERAAPGAWRVTFDSGGTRAYAGVIVAAGIHWIPNLPDVPGTFTGESMHSVRYRTPEIFREKRVLIVGAGNSGCDIAVDAGQHAAKTFLSVRRGYHYIPKHAFGRPIDQLGELGIRLGLPLFVRRRLNQLVLAVVAGNPARYGLPRPDHRLLESHPIVNSQLLPAIARGEIVPKPDLVELRDDAVVFKDGSSEKVDLIVYATGYRVSFPFLDESASNTSNGAPELYLHLAHPRYDDLFILGMIMPDSGVWRLLDLQARVVARLISAAGGTGAGLPEFRALKQGPRPDLGGGIRYVASERHRYEVEHSSYERRLKALLRLLGS
jgi:cation diffusion facilitator CzcD-associated flavoprotein CzcO